MHEIPRKVEPAVAKVAALVEAQQPRLRWLLGFRSDVMWKKVVALIFYGAMALSILGGLLMGRAGTVFGDLLILGLVLGLGAVPMFRGAGASSPSAGRGARAFRYQGGTLFPDSTFSITEDAVFAPWPAILKQACKKGERLLFVPIHQGQVSEYGTVALVTGVEPLYEFTGLNRVRIVKTVPEGTGSGASSGPPTWLLFMSPPLYFLLGGRRSTTNTKPGAVFRCSYIPLTDVVTDAAEDLMAEVKPLFLRYMARFPDGATRSKTIDGVTDPASFVNRVSQAMFRDDAQSASLLLASDDVAWRLRTIADWLGATGASTQPDAVPDSANFAVERPDSLPTFADVGGMAELKQSLRETVGLVIQHPDVVEQMDVNFNGILLYGPPGTGKTNIARATAGEFQMSFLSVTGGDLKEKYMGESEKRIQAAFRAARRNAPSLLFFDEFDAIAGKRGEGGGNEQFQQGVVGQLLRSLEEIRRTRGVTVMAATNDIDSLDPAVVRPGRFDQRVRVDLPDPEARRAILQTRMRDLPVAGRIDLDGLIADTEGRSAADLVSLIDAGKLKALKRAVGLGTNLAALTQEDLETALADRRGKDAPTVTTLTWDDLILPASTKKQLHQLVDLIANPRSGEELGKRSRPSGALLYGPPGTGKTTIAKVMASEIKGKVSFLPIKGSEIRSKWVGDSAKNVRDLFDRARAGAPTIIFIDEIDALLPRRDGADGQSADEQIVNEFLQQLDGMDSTPGVFVLGATNLPEKLDPAVTRSGRIGRKIEIPLPGAEERQKLFELHTRDMKLGPDVDLDALARQTERYSGADIETLSDEAIEHAYERTEGPHAVTQEDFIAVLRRRRPVQRVPKRGWEDLILPEETIDQLRELAAAIADPDAGRDFGLDRPSGAVLYGPPGTGKTTVAQVLASELEGDVSFLSVKGSDLITKYVGDSPKNVRELFDKARRQTPAIIFIDEIEALLGKRSASGGGSAGEQVVTEFLQQLDGIDSSPGVFVLGATNLLDKLDPAVLRGGRLGTKIEIPLPTLENRTQLFALHLRNMQVSGDVDTGALARQTERYSGADIESLCQEAGQHAYRRRSGERKITAADFEAVLARRRTVAQVQARTWDDVVLPVETKQTLKALAQLIADPDAAAAFGVQPPTGALLYGPPGTGKTTIAKVFATELASQASFLSAKGSDLVGSYVGESAQKVRDLFDRARAASPAVIFIDEIESLLPARGSGGPSGGGGAERESVVTEFLQQLDGLNSSGGIFVLGATNLPDRVDPAALRGGRLSRHIEIPLPTLSNREELFRRNTAAMTLAADVDLATLASQTSGRSGADIASLCSAAAEHAFMRGTDPKEVTAEDFAAVVRTTRHGASTA